MMVHISEWFELEPAELASLDTDPRASEIGRWRGSQNRMGQLAVMNAFLGRTDKYLFVVVDEKNDSYRAFSGNEDHFVFSRFLEQLTPR